MVDGDFIELITYAIEREKAAAKFYSRLQQMTTSKASKELLGSLEKMELAHAKVLGKFTHEDSTSEFIAPKIANLKISDYMTVPPPSDEMTFQEVLVLAMKREDASNKLYLALANEADDEKTKNLFLRLASEEAKHKNQLETIYDEEILSEN